MFTPLEAKAKQSYQACDKKGDLTPKKILVKMDMIHEEGLLLCQPVGELQISGLPLEGPGRCRPCFHAEGDPGM